MDKIEFLKTIDLTKEQVVFIRCDLDKRDDPRGIAAQLQNVPKDSKTKFVILPKDCEVNIDDKPEQKLPTVTNEELRAITGQNLPSGFLESLNKSLVERANADNADCIKYRNK